MQPIKEINYTIADEGNWTIGYAYKGYGYVIKRPGGGLVCTMPDGLRSEEKALAQLVCAAPDLLAALKVMISHWPSLGCTHGHETH
jgi:hypothetical protein